VANRLAVERRENIDIVIDTLYTVDVICFLVLQTAIKTFIRNYHQL